MRGFDWNVAGIGALADPVRRRLYRFVCSQSEPVSRDQAAQAVGIARHQAKFHLDRLAADGLLETDYVRLTGRSGRGAGRPAKRYRRGRTEFALSLPSRDYELAGQLMAEAIDESTSRGIPIAVALSRAATSRGAALSTGVAGPTGRPRSAEAALDLIAGPLAEHGYEPRRAAAEIVLVNCPFRALASRHPALVCGMNEALLVGLVNGLAPGLLTARLAPGNDRCCVIIRAPQTTSSTADQ